MTVSRETSERLEIYESLVRRWNPRINLVASGTLAVFRDRHITDSQYVARLTDARSGVWLDLGSGGGLPGLVLAIEFAYTALDFILVESDLRKAAFLRTVVRETGLQNVRVMAHRIESLSPQSASYASARALAPLPQLMAYLDRHLLPDGKAFLMKGQRWQDEVRQAQRDWTFDCVAHPSPTEPGAATLEISGVTRGAP